MRVLAIETSTSHGSVAVFALGDLIFEERFTADRRHSSTLFIALEKSRTTAAKFDRLAVGLGPGSYAGVRIAIAAALGMNLVLESELVGVPSVAALETSVPAYLVVGDARRDAFYFTHVDRGRCIHGPLLATEDEVRREIVARALPVFGTESLPAFPSIQLAIPSAAEIARVASEDHGVTQRGDLEPLYLREPHITPAKHPPGLPSGARSTKAKA